MNISEILTKNPELLLVSFIVILTITSIALIFIIDTIISYIKFKKLLKNPELAKTLIEKEQKELERVKKHIHIPPVLIPKRVKVIVIREHELLEDVCKFDGETARCRNLKMLFTIPENYKPYISSIKGKKVMVTFLFDEKNNALTIKTNNNIAEVEKITIDPRVQESVIGTKIFYHVFRRFAGIDTSSLLAGLGLGIFAFTFIVFFILPLLGHPVTIGKQPVEITIHEEIAQPTLPPPGNYTLTGG